MENIKTFNTLYGFNCNGYFLSKTGTGNPLVLYRFQNYTLECEDDIFRFVDTLPIRIETKKIEYNDFMMHSKYKNTYFELIFFNIFDSNLLNEPKTICLLITNDTHSLNDTINLQKIAKFIYQQNILQFSKEIITKIHAIKSQIKKEGIEILYQTAKDLNLNVDDEKMLIDERFLMSAKRNPDLLFNKELCIDAFNEYVAFAPYQYETKSSKEIEFGIANISKFNFFAYAASNDQRSLYVKLANSTILAHILYTLLIERPLIIKTNDTQRFLNMAAKLSCFIPNFKISNVITRDCVNPIELSDGMICISKDVQYDNVENVSILSIDQNFYEGVIAEKDSVIMDFSKMEPAQSSPNFLFTAYFRAHQLFNKIELCICKTVKEDKSEYNIYKSLIKIGIKRCDYHLVSKWFRLLGYNDESELLLRHAPPIQKGACFF